MKRHVVLGLSLGVLWAVYANVAFAQGSGPQGLSPAKGSKALKSLPAHADDAARAARSDRPAKEPPGQVRKQNKASSESTAPSGLPRGHSPGDSTALPSHTASPGSISTAHVSHTTAAVPEPLPPTAPRPTGVRVGPRAPDARENPDARPLAFSSRLMRPHASEAGESSRGRVASRPPKMSAPLHSGSIVSDGGASGGSGGSAAPPLFVALISLLVLIVPRMASRFRAAAAPALATMLVAGVAHPD